MTGDNILEEIDAIAGGKSVDVAVGGEPISIGSIQAFSCAGFWIRTVAMIIDMAAVLAISMAIFFFYIAMTLTAEGIEVGTTDEELKQLAGIIANVIGFIYFTVLTGLPIQATLGKYLLGLKVVLDTGRRIGYWRSFWRCFSYIFSIIPLLLGFVMVGTTLYKTGLHDLIAGTRVVRR